MLIHCADAVRRRGDVLYRASVILSPLKIHDCCGNSFSLRAYLTIALALWLLLHFHLFSVLRTLVLCGTPFYNYADPP